MANRSDGRRPTLFSVKAHFHEHVGMSRDTGTERRSLGGVTLTDDALLFQQMLERVQEVLVVMFTRLRGAA